MKICLFSDIHANKYAFEAALPLLLKEKADKYIFLGDICGYYFHPLEAWQLLQQIPRLLCIRGNHDNMLLDFSRSHLVPDCYSQKYGPSLKILLERQDRDLQPFLSYLSSLSSEFTDKENHFTCTHAYPDKEHEYLYPDTQPSDLNSEKLVFFGHTHYPTVLSNKQTLFINPGSIGQPRNGKPPSFATLILSTKQVIIHSFSYNYQALLDELASFKNIPPYLSEIIRKSFCKSI